MKFFAFLTALSIFSSVFSEEASKEEMRVYEALAHRDLILTFVSHPKTQEFFINQMKKKDEFYRSCDAEMQSFLKEYPDSKQARWINWPYLMQIVNFNIVNKEIVVPFLTWGVANLYGLEDAKLIDDLRQFQVRLFADFLASEGLLLGEEMLEQDLIAFCKDSPLPLFSQVIGPLVSLEIEVMDSDEEGYTIEKPWKEIVRFYSGEDRLGENVSYDQRRQLECVYNPFGEHCKRWERMKEFQEFPFYEERLQQMLSELKWNDPAQDDEELEETEKALVFEDPASLAFDQIARKEEDFFPKEKILDLFFEVLEETYPQLRDVLLLLKQERLKSLT